MGFVCAIYAALFTIILVSGQRIPQHYVKIDRTTTLKCPHKSLETTHIWSGPENLTTYSIWDVVNKNLSKKSRISIESPYNNLVIANVSYEDAGYYQCVTVDNNAPVQYNIQLIIAEPPSNLTIENVTSNNTVYEREGAYVVLQCRVDSGIPVGDILWMNDNKILAKAASNQVVYNLTTKRRHHLQFYTCQANNGFYQLQRTIQLVLALKPTVQINAETELKIKEGETEKLVCSHSTNTIPTKTIWKFADEVISVDQTELLLQNVTRNNTGIYTCLVTNEIGEGNASVSVMVEYKPVLLRQNVTVLFEAEINEPISIKFVVESVTKPDISWTNSAGGIHSSWNVIRCREDTFQILSTVVPRTQRHFGHYGLIIRNDIGSLDVGFTLVSNLIKLRPQSYVCNVSSYVRLECALQRVNDLGLHPIWIHEVDNTVVRNVPSSISSNVSLMTIKFCDYRDAGKYICKWMSDSIEYTASASLIVYDIPIVISKQISLILNSVRLELALYSVPPPTSVIWFQNDNKLRNGLAINSSLTKSTVMLMLFGSPIQVDGYMVQLLIQEDVYSSNAQLSCKIDNFIGNIETVFTNEEIRNSLDNYNHTIDRKSPASNDKSMITSILVYIGASLILIAAFGFGFNLHKKLQPIRSQTVGTDGISAESDPINSTELSSTAIVQEISSDENEYEEVETEHPVETNAQQPRHGSNSSDSFISDRSYLDFELHSYEEMKNSDLEQHEYLEYVNTSD